MALTFLQLPAIKGTDWFCGRVDMTPQDGSMWPSVMSLVALKTKDK